MNEHQAAVISKGFCIVNTILFEDNRIRLIGFTVNPRNLPAKLSISVNGAQAALTVHRQHSQLAATFRLEHVYYFEAVAPAPQTNLIEIDGYFAGSETTDRPKYYFSRQRPPLPDPSRRTRVHGTEEVNSFDLVGCTVAQAFARTCERVLERPISTLRNVLD